jgi:phage gpG-like protein
MFAVEVDDSKVRAYFREFSPRLMRTLPTHVERYAIYLQSYVRQNKLSGDPLHRRSGNLSASINYTPVTVSDNSVQTSEGTNLEYGRIHELGGTFSIPAHTAVSSRGNEYLVRQHEATYPKRAFLAPSLLETQGVFTDEINQAVKESINGAA